MKKYLITVEVEVEVGDVAAAEHIVQLLTETAEIHEDLVLSCKTDLTEVG